MITGRLLVGKSEVKVLKNSVVFVCETDGTVVVADRSVFIIYHFTDDDKKNFLFFKENLVMKLDFLLFKFNHKKLFRLR